MVHTINLAEARKRLPELTDLARTGETYILSKHGRELAALIGIDEYQRLKAMEDAQQSKRDFDLLLAPPAAESITEDEARQLAVQVVREARAAYQTKTNR